jgi:hypothetical protein
MQTPSLTQLVSAQTSNLSGGSSILGGLQPTDLLVFGGIAVVAVVLIAIVMRGRGKPEGPLIQRRSDTSDL